MSDDATPPLKFHCGSISFRRDIAIEFTEGICRAGRTSCFPAGAKSYSFTDVFGTATKDVENPNCRKPARRIGETRLRTTLRETDGRLRSSRSKDGEFSSPGSVKYADTEILSVSCILFWTKTNEKFRAIFTARYEVRCVACPPYSPAIISSRSHSAAATSAPASARRAARIASTRATTGRWAAGGASGTGSAFQSSG